MLNLDMEIQYLKWIGPKRARAFAKLGVKTIEDILTFFPVQYHDRTKIVSLGELCEHLQSCIFVKIGHPHERRFTQNLYVLDVEIFDDTSMAYARFFRNKSYYCTTDVFAVVKKTFKSGSFAYIHGNIKIEYGSRFVNVNDYEVVRNEGDRPLLFNKIIPIYPVVKGLPQKFIREFIKNILKFNFELYPGLLNLIPDFDGISKLESKIAIQKIHCPVTLEDVEDSRRTLALQEFFIFESAISLLRNNVKKRTKLQKYEVKKTLLTAFKNNLKFKFTKDQIRAINDIFSDMQSMYPMNRMLMGDVGSGKTVVALSAILLAVENGYQTMIIVPTEILAEQHYFTISSMLINLGIKIALVTSSVLKKRSVREKILTEFKNGDIKIAVGTHSLIEDRIKFKNLSLVIVDEQHKFGVVQKFAALDKAQSPDILMITATPIPRTLAMTLYGEMDITTIKQLPQGRIPIKTYSLSEQLAYKNMIKELRSGNQAYIVYPLIEESDKFYLKSVVRESEKLSQTWFKDFKVGILHGKMKSSEKKEIMEKFKNKKFDILITTTVIEVGIDIPDVTVIIVQHAERFGLSDLHQLRGRVGRNYKQSYAYLINNSSNEDTCKRLSIIVSTNDGFKIAEEDLKMRGSGELLGTVQHGFQKFKAGDLIRDADIIEFTKILGAKIIEEDPDLSKNENIVLKKFIYKYFLNKAKFVNVG